MADPSTRLLERLLIQAHKENCIIVCKNPSYILDVAKKAGITTHGVISYEQASKMLECKQPVMFDSYTNFIQYLYPIFDIHSFCP